jgi:hypothetical protein
MSMGVLGAVLLYLKWVVGLPGSQAHERKSRKATRTKKATQLRAVWIIASATAYFAALLAKETAIVLPALILRWHYVCREAKTEIQISDDGWCWLSGKLYRSCA